jgi:hypothetical protein
VFLWAGGRGDCWVRDEALRPRVSENSKSIYSFHLRATCQITVRSGTVSVFVLSVTVSVDV